MVTITIDGLEKYCPLVTSRHKLHPSHLLLHHDMLHSLNWHGNASGGQFVHACHDAIPVCVIHDCRVNVDVKSITERHYM